MPRRSKAQKYTNIDHRRTKVAEMYLRGSYQVAIAEEVGVDQSMISHDLKAIRQEWKQSRLRDYGEWVEQELAKIDELERTYWDAWQRSVGRVTIKMKKSGSNFNGTYEEEATKAETKVGNPKFLDGVMKCIEKRAKLLGLDAAPDPEDGKGGVTNNTYILYAAQAKPLPVAEERKIGHIPGKVLPPGGSLADL